jgi:hypothetical protein
MLVLGILINEASGTYNKNDLYVYPPNYVKNSGATISSGVMICFFGILLLCYTFTNPTAPTTLVVFGLILWLWLITGHVMFQIAYAGAAFSAAACVLTSLLSILILGPIFVVTQRYKQIEDDDTQRQMNTAAHVNQQFGVGSLTGANKL